MAFERGRNAAIFRLIEAKNEVDVDIDRFFYVSVWNENKAKNDKVISVKMSFIKSN